VVGVAGQAPRLEGEHHLGLEAANFGNKTLHHLGGVGSALM
jgi:hypothetical protein